MISLILFYEIFYTGDYKDAILEEKIKNITPPNYFQ